MATMDAEALFVDTCVLIEATDVRRAHHARAQATLRGERALWLSAQVLREYLSVATRPAPVNGLGLPMKLALENVDRFSAALPLIDGERTWATLRRLLADVACAGKQVHDAALAAHAHAHGAGVLTLNTADFRAFARWIPVVDLADM